MIAVRHTLRGRHAWALALGIALLLGGCGGGGDDGAGQQQAQAVGAAGGTVAGPGGAQAVVAPGALASDTPIAISQGGLGAPALPGGFAAFGPMLAFTPHGVAFAMPVTVTVPFDPAALPAGATPVLYKTDGQGAWQRVDGAAVGAGVMTAAVASFSYFLVGNLPPQITQQPQDSSVAEPDAAMFFVTALGTPPFTYRWQRSDDGGATFSDVAGGSAALSTPPTSVNDDNGDRYRVIVGNLEGSSTSRPALLTVASGATAPVIPPPPPNAPVAPPTGGRYTLTVSVSGEFGEVWGFEPNQAVPDLQCINSPGGPNPCSQPYRPGTRVTLVPQTSAGTVVWTGCDEDRGKAGCIVVMNGDRGVTARFQ